jgi:REP element-mobilizing transposase RayT
MPQSFGSLHCHIVLSTKHRQSLIDPAWQDRLFEYIGGITRSHSCVLIAAGGTADHVHLLLSISRTVSVADAARQIKSNSSGWVHGTLGRMDFQWQVGYGAFAVSYSNLAAVKIYIANQEEHHRKMTYQDEFRELLRRHDIQWDERYVWD